MFFVCTAYLGIYLSHLTPSRFRGKIKQPIAKRTALRAMGEQLDQSMISISAGLAPSQEVAPIDRFRGTRQILA